MGLSVRSRIHAATLSMEPSVTKLPPSKTVCTASKTGSAHPIEVVFGLDFVGVHQHGKPFPAGGAAGFHIGNPTGGEGGSNFLVHDFEDGEAILSMMSGRKSPCPQG